MKPIDPDEYCTFYFIIKYKDGEKSIQAWTDDKNLALSYMKFHNCKNFTMKKIRKLGKHMIEVLEENTHDEISLFNIGTRDTKHKYETKSITVPATQTEINFLNDESNTLASSLINYSIINNYIYYMKSKYQKALNNIGLVSCMNFVLHNNKSKFTSLIQFDQLLLLYRLFPENFD